jgi:hypothetical protein
MGTDVAIDGSDLPAYANGQRYVSKGGRERERFSDPDASWGHRSAVSTRSGGGYYGYKLHAAVCTAPGLPLAWTVETASAAEASVALRVLDAARERGYQPRSVAMDKGYDSNPIHDGSRRVTFTRSSPFARRLLSSAASIGRRAASMASGHSPGPTLSAVRRSGAARPASASRVAGGSRRRAFTR